MSLYCSDQLQNLQDYCNSFFQKKLFFCVSISELLSWGNGCLLKARMWKLWRPGTGNFDSPAPNPHTLISSFGGLTSFHKADPSQIFQHFGSPFLLSFCRHTLGWLWAQPLSVLLGLCNIWVLSSQWWWYQWRRPIVTVWSYQSSRSTGAVSLLTDSLHTFLHSTFPCRWPAGWRSMRISEDMTLAISFCSHRNVHF